MATHVFEDFEIDTDLFELRQRGERVVLRAQAFDVLACLVEAQGRVVTKEELVERVWAGSRMSDAAIPQAILAIRRALGDDGNDPRIVHTLRGRGYRFVAPLAAPALESHLPLVGRERLLATARVLVGRATAGDGGVMLIAGDAGVGKSRALLEIGSLARASGAEVLSARAYEDEGVPPLWPWTQIMRAADVNVDETEAIRSFDLVSRTLVGRSRKTPLVVVLDDLHLADASSLLLAKLVAQSFRDARALLVLGYRDVKLADHPVLARTVGALVREDPARSVALEPLSRAAIATLGQAALGEALPDASVARLEAKTAGYPLFLTQLLHAMRSDARLATGATSELLAGGAMREALLHHLADLPASCHEVLAAASVLGRRFSFGTLARMVERSADDLAPMVEAALRARVLSRASSGTLSFVHELVMDVFYKKLGLPDRKRLHAAASRALAAADPESARRHEERVRHLTS